MSCHLSRRREFLLCASAVSLGCGSNPDAGFRPLFNGKALVVVRTSRSAGAIRLTASAAGLKPATLTVTSRPGPTIPTLPLT